MGVLHFALTFLLTLGGEMGYTLSRYGIAEEKRMSKRVPEKRKVMGVRFPLSVWKGLRERAVEETEEKGYIVSATTIMIRAIKTELAKAVRRG